MLANSVFVNMLHPGIILILMGLLLLCLPKSYSRKVYVVAPILAFTTLFVINEDSSIPYSISDSLLIDFINVDQLSYIFLVAFLIIAIIASIYNHGADTKAEMAATLIYAGSNMGVVIAADCISLLVFWELGALASCYVVYCGNCRKSTRAAFRYLLYHAFGGGMLLWGLMSYMVNYGNDLTNISDIAGTATFWIILIGVCVNAAVPPLNSWLPDAYPESTLGGTIFLGSYTTKAAIYLMIRLFAGTEWLVWVGAFMAIYGVIMATLENDMRRLLSYHIISQLGYMVAALAIGDAWGVDGAAAHAFSNIMYKGVLLMCVGAVIYCTGKRKISELGGIAKKMPFTAVCFLIASLAIAGFPFLNGFASKALVMHAVEEYRVIFYLLTAASVGTWLSIVMKMNVFIFWGPDRNNTEIKRKEPLSMKIAMGLGTLACIFTGILPNSVYKLTPFATDGHPFTVEHVLEYLLLFVGTTFVFWLFRKIMLPHDEISLDFDWFFRRPMFKAVNAISIGLNKSFAWFHDFVISGVRHVSARMSDPYLITENSEKTIIKNFSFENKDKAIGDVLTVIVGIVAIMVVIGAIIV